MATLGGEEPKGESRTLNSISILRRAEMIVMRNIQCHFHHSEFSYATPSWMQSSYAGVTLLSESMFCSPWLRLGKPLWASTSESCTRSHTNIVTAYSDHVKRFTYFLFSEEYTIPDKSVIRFCSEKNTKFIFDRLNTLVPNCGKNRYDYFFKYFRKEIRNELYYWLH